MRIWFITLSLLLFSTAPAFAKVPACMDKKDRLEFNESQVLVWRELLEKKFTARAFIKGILVQVMEDRQKHIHFEVDLDDNLGTNDDRIEVIYNTQFGPIPEYQPGDEVIACGDFVVDPYSPHKGVIHWLHTSPKRNAHDDGYLMINGILTGNIVSKVAK